MLAKQRRYLRIAPPEIAEDLSGRLRPPESEHGLAVSRTQPPHSRVISKPGFLKRPVAVRTHHLGPLVSVVPRGVPARKDVRKRTKKQILGDHRQTEVRKNFVFEG